MNKIVFFVLVIIALPLFAMTQSPSMDSLKFLQNTEISGNWFMAYSYDKESEENKFQLKRGYFTIKQKLSDTYSVRYTQDITLDKEGDDAGNVEMRLKYLYLKINLDNIRFLKNSYLELGLVHTPLLDFEQHINLYRIQEQMYTEYNKIISSADFGVSLIGLLGGKIDDNYRKKVNNSYAGKYGSYSLGVYNGGGYYAVEENKNKTIEGRLSLRPFPTVMPGMQFTYAFSYGHANINEDERDYNMNLFMISSESQFHTLTMQLYKGKGDNRGTYYKITEYENHNVYEAYKNHGLSVFAELKIPNSKISVCGRYDEFISKQDTKLKRQTLLAGVAYRFLKNKFVLGYNKYKTDNSEKNMLEASLDITF